MEHEPRLRRYQNRRTNIIRDIVNVYNVSEREAREIEHTGVADKIAELQAAQEHRLQAIA